MTQRSLRVALGIVTIAASLIAAQPGFAQGSGEKVYKDKCVSCHGPDGAGATPVGKATKAPNICSDEAKKMGDADWTQIIIKGKNKMPSFNKKLTDTEIKDLIAYMRGLCKK